MLCFTPYFSTLFDAGEIEPHEGLAIATMITTFINKNESFPEGLFLLNNNVKPRYFLTKSATKVEQTYPV